jgi:lytic starch monooxygenase
MCTVAWGMAGASYWYSQSCTIGCAECNVTTDVATSMLAGDLCPNDNTGDKTPTITDPALRTWMGDGCLNASDPTRTTRAACTADTPPSLDWTRYHPWRAPGRAPMYDPCGMAGASPSNNSQAAGGFGYMTIAEKQGFRGSRLPRLSGTPLRRWKAGGTAEVAWATVANHGGGYHYSLCPAEKDITEACFHALPLTYADSGTQRLRYVYLNNTANTTEVTIPAVRVARGTIPEGSVWTRHPVPSGVTVPDWAPSGRRNGKVPQFDPPAGCDERCWGYQPCNIGFVHPSYEGWNDVNRKANRWVGPGKDVPTQYPACGEAGEGCCHTMAYMAVVDTVRVPAVPAGDYVLRWRWDAEGTPQIWANCADVLIE